MPLQNQHTSSDSDNCAGLVPVKKIPINQMPYPLEKLESNVAQTWSSLELLSQDFAQMWDQIEKLESIMSLQRQIISTVNQPTSYNSQPLNSSPSIRPNEGASLNMNPKPSSSSEQQHQQRQFIYNTQLPPEDAEVKPSDFGNLSHYSWSEFFNIPSTNDSSAKSNLPFSEYDQLSVTVGDHRNNLNKGDIPTIRFQTYCDDGIIANNGSSCTNRFQQNIDLRSSLNQCADLTIINNPESFENTSFGYELTDKAFSKSEMDSASGPAKSYSICKIDNLKSSPSRSTSYYLPKSYSSLSLDNTFNDNLPHQISSAHTYYSPQPKRRSASSSSQSPRMGYSCPILDSCVNLNAISPSSSNSYLSRATECSSLPHSDYCSPIDSKYTNPFLHDSFNDVRAGGKTVDRLIGESNFIIRPTDHIVSQCDNVINTLEQYHEQVSPPDSPPPPAPQDHHTYYYQRGNSYDDYYHENEQQYEYVEPINSTNITLDIIEDSDPEDIISKINYMYETEFQSNKNNNSYSMWNTPQATTAYQSQINDETLDLIDQLQENMQLRNALASSKYKSWTNIQQDHSSYQPIPSLAEYTSLLPALPDKSSVRYQSAGPEQFQHSRLSPRPFSNRPTSNTYGSSTYNFKDPRRKLQTTSFIDQQKYSTPQTMHEIGSHMSSVYSLAGSSGDQYTTVFTSGVPKFESTRSNTPDLLGSGHQRILDKHEMAKNFPTHSYKPEDIPSTRSIRPQAVPHPTSPTFYHKQNDFIATTIPSSTSSSYHNLPSHRQFTPISTSSSSSNATGIFQRHIFEANASSRQIPGADDSKGKPQEAKKSRRGTLRSAFSTVGTSVSHWIPNFQHLAHRRHSFPTPSPMSDEFCSASATTGSPKKKKHSIISVMTGIFHKSHKTNSFNSSDNSDSTVSWNNMAINHHNHEDVFIEPNYHNQFPDLTKGIKNIQTSTQVSPAPTVFSKRPSVVVEEVKSLPIAMKMDEQELHQQKQSLSDLNDEEKPDLAYETAETPTLAQPIISEALAAKYAMNPVIAVDSFEENEICDIEDDHSVATTTESKTPEVSVIPKRYTLPKQFSLDVSPGFQNDDYKEDSKSNHSWCSAISKTSSRRQSTEESIDTEDEWYMYECRKLENMEQQSSLDRDLSVNRSFSDGADTTHTMQEFSRGQVSEEPKFDLEVWQEEPKLEDITEYETSVDETREYETTEIAYTESPLKDIYDLPADELETISLKAAENNENEKQYRVEELVSTDEMDLNEPINKSQDEVVVETIDVHKTTFNKELEPTVTNEESEDIIPGTPSLPRFRYDKSESGESPHASKEEISKDGLGSKWKLLKALKERKAEEKSKEAEPPPPVVSIFFNLH